MVESFYYAVMVIGPMVVLGFTCVYAFRALRLLVMYNPHMRASWGGLLRQHAVIKSLVFLFALVELGAWSASLGLRVSR